MSGKESGDGSGCIWDHTTMPLGITSKQRIGLEKAWAKIPKRYTQDIGKLTIETGMNGISEASYDRLTKNITIIIGDSTDFGAPASLHHEIHHHMWHAVRTLEQKYEWWKGVCKIMSETGKSPTIYSDSFVSFVLLGKAMRRYKKLVTYEKNMERGVTSIGMCYPKYADLKKDLERDPKQSDTTAYFIYSNTTSGKEPTLEGMKEHYDNCSEKEKIELIKQNYAEMKCDLLDDNDDFFGEMEFYDESHSETGKYIYAKKSMMERASMYELKYPSSHDTGQNFGINDDVMDRYVALYHRVFGQQHHA